MKWSQEGIGLFTRRNVSNSGFLFMSLKSLRFHTYCTINFCFHPFMHKLKEEDSLMSTRLHQDVA